MTLALDKAMSSKQRITEGDVTNSYASAGEASARQS